LQLVVAALSVIPLLIVGRKRRVRKSLVWAPAPILSNKYWSAAMREAGWESYTVVREVYTTINSPDDFDFTYDSLTPGWIRSTHLRQIAGPYFAAAFVLRRACVLHIPFYGGPLGETPLRRFEAAFLRRAGIKTVLIPYGSDVNIYSRIPDAAVRHVFLGINPLVGRHEHMTRTNVEYWTLNADVIVIGFTTDGIPRWDIPGCCSFVLDIDQWKPSPKRSYPDGRNETVRIYHSANHKFVKGTPFIERAVAELKEEGLKVELVFAELIQNATLPALLETVDLHVDQLIIPGYALAAIEAMSVGLPVVANLGSERTMRVFRRYAFLDECPVVSGDPETIKDVLRALITNPELRQELGSAGRAYVKKYHSYDAARYLFGSIYAKLLDGAAVDLMQLYDPSTSALVRSSPRICHPLVESRLPPELLKAGGLGMR
jgi:glycosyltransferase involved in cell wall biosynthesis